MEGLPGGRVSTRRFQALRSFFGIESGQYYNRGGIYPLPQIDEAVIEGWEADARILVFRGPTGVVGGRFHKREEKRT